ncbi:response regulator [Parapedobacter soli]|uniref:response regulator n=1 Tax=Parapedobacter soli TaxID=416955 RepID=UPI0021C56ED3|nr:response regulator transcription factor [Parapedobacter soli]
MTNVFIIDDHQMVIDGFKHMLDAAEDISLIGWASLGEEGISQIKKCTPDIILLDINLPDISGIEVCKRLMNEYPQGKIIAISMHQESSLIKLMLQHGARGYVLKNAGQDELLKSIHAVAGGKIYLENTVNEIVVNSIGSPRKEAKLNPFPTLSRREKEVLDLILKEYTTQEIAESLFIGFGTVETHRRNMMAKIGARNTAGLVRIALEYGLAK